MSLMNNLEDDYGEYQEMKPIPGVHKEDRNIQRDFSFPPRDFYVCILFFY